MDVLLPESELEFQSRFSARASYRANSRLTEAEITAYRCKPFIDRGIADALRASGRTPGETTILDFGCGRGELVAHLRSRGFAAFGVDVQARYVRNGQAYFETTAPEVPALSLIDGQGECIFPDESFDIVITDDVLEHVRDLERATREIARVTRKGGIGLHGFPGRWRLREPHLDMPLVHWLPKNAVRQILLRLWTQLGVGVDVSCESAPGAPADLFFEFLARETFYRPNQEIVASFERAGLVCDPRERGRGRLELTRRRSALSRALFGSLPCRRLAFRLSSSKKVYLFTQRQ